MSSSMNDVSIPSAVTAHLDQTIEILNDNAVSVPDIDSFMYKIVENQCDFYGISKDGDNFLLYRALVSDLTNETDLFSPINENISENAKAREISHKVQEQFRIFKNQFSSGSSSFIFPSLFLEHGENAAGKSYCHSARLVGTLYVHDQPVKITFGSLMDFEHLDNCGDLMREAMRIAEEWSRGLTVNNLESRLATPMDGVRVIHLVKQEELLQADEGVPFPGEDLEVDEDLLLAMELEKQLNGEISVFDVFQQKKPQLSYNPPFDLNSNFDVGSINRFDWIDEKPMVRFSDIEDKAKQNAWEAREILEGIIMSTNPYQDRSAEEIFNGIHLDLVPQKLGKNNIDSNDAKNWSYRVTFDKCYWMIPIINSDNTLITTEHLIDKLRPVVYFGPKINDLLVHWAGRGVYLSTDFCEDIEVGQDGEKITKQVCTMGMFKVDQLTCCELDALSTMHEGVFKKRIEIPMDIYKTKPEELIAGIQQNIHLFIDNMLVATGCNQPDSDKNTDVGTMIEALHSPILHSRLEDLGAKLWWTFLTPKGIPNALKLYIDLKEEERRAEVYALFRGFMGEIDFERKWGLSILSEAVNQVREWGKGDSMVRDPVPPLCIQMSWNAELSPNLSQLINFIDKYEPTNLREYGMTTRSVGVDGLQGSIIVELHVPKEGKLSAAEAGLLSFLNGAARECQSPEQPELAWIVQKLDSAVRTEGGFALRRPNTLRFVVRSISGPMGQMVNFLKEWSGIENLKFTPNGSQALVVEAEAPDAKTKGKMDDQLDSALSKAESKIEVPPGSLWIYENRLPSGNKVSFHIQLYSEQSFGVSYENTDSNFFSPFGDFSSRRHTSVAKPKPTQFDPGYGKKEITADTLDEIFDFSDDL